MSHLLAAGQGCGEAVVQLAGAQASEGRLRRRGDEQGCALRPHLSRQDLGEVAPASLIRQVAQDVQHGCTGVAECLARLLEGHVMEQLQAVEVVLPALPWMRSPKELHDHNRWPQRTSCSDGRIEKSAAGYAPHLGITNLSTSKPLEVSQASSALRLAHGMHPAESRCETLRSANHRVATANKSVVHQMAETLSGCGRCKYSSHRVLWKKVMHRAMLCRRTTAIKRRLSRARRESSSLWILLTSLVRTLDPFSMPACTSHPLSGKSKKCDESRCCVNA